jgi:hypothetical protein
MNKLRILYLWNTAGALSPVADWLLDNGHKARIVMSTEFDLFGSTSISRAAQMVTSNKEYYREVIRQLRAFKPTHVHVNANLPSLVIARLMLPTTPIVFHYHGIEVRYRSSVHPEMVLADKVIVSTPDLHQYGDWYDRPVAKMFYYRGGRKLGTAFMYYADFFMKDLREEAQKWCDERGLDLTTVVRGEHPGIPYTEIPEFLSQFEYFLDFKGYGNPKAISRLAIEAFACGCKVVSDTNPSRVIDDYELPKPEIYYNLYTSLEKPPFSMKRIWIALRGLLKWANGILKRLPEAPRRQ